jgi:hypothetical protein
MRLTLRDENNRISNNRLAEEVAIARHLQRDLGLSRSEALRAAAEHVARQLHRRAYEGNAAVVSVTIERLPGDNGGPALGDD